MKAREGAGSFERKPGMSCNVAQGVLWAAKGALVTILALAWRDDGGTTTRPFQDLTGEREGGR